MRGGRLLMVVATLVAILVCPLLLREAVQSSRLPSVYAAQSAFDTGGRVYQNGNNNDNDGRNNDDDDDDNGGDNDNNNNNDGDDDDNNGNDNDVCFENLNSNEEVPCDFDNDNFRRDNDNVHAAPRNPRESFTGLSKCFDVGEVGVIQMGHGSFDVTVAVLPHSSFGSVTRLRLNLVDPATVPAPPSGATLLDSVLFSLDAQAGCDGSGIGTLPSDVNLGITYNVPADKSRLRIVRLEGGQWVEVNTVPDPSPTNPYISSTIRQAGIYAVVQR